MLSFFNKSVSQTTPLASIYDIQINQLNGDPLDLSTFKDKYILFVNVASQCGFTGQYEDLQKHLAFDFTNLQEIILYALLFYCLKVW